MNDDLSNRLNEMLQNGSAADFKVIEAGIDFAVVKDYWVLIHQHAEPWGEEELAEGMAQLLDTDTEQERIILTQLGRSGSVKAYRALERYVDNVTDELQRKWGVIAMQHCRVKLENELLDEPIGFIATGLGGKGSKIRYYFVLIANEELSAVMVKEVEAYYREIATEYDAEIEAVEQIDGFISVRLLLPVQGSLKALVQQGVAMYPFLEEEFIMTNMAHPTRDLIHEWLAERNQANETSEDNEADDEDEDDTEE